MVRKRDAVSSKIDKILHKLIYEALDETFGKEEADRKIVEIFQRRRIADEEEVFNLSEGQDNEEDGKSGRA